MAAGRIRAFIVALWGQDDAWGLVSLSKLPQLWEPVLALATLWPANMQRAEQLCDALDT